MKTALSRYRFMANVVGVLLIVLILVGVPLANFDGSGMWHLFPGTPDLVTPGSDVQRFGEAITNYLDEKRLEAKDIFIEEYLTDPTKTPEDQLVINIFVPTK